MSLRRSAPRPVKVYGRRLSRTVGAATAGWRMRPACIVVGAQRCGTTSLYRALAAHPLVFGPVLHKGVHYFDVNFYRDRSWYYGHFPLRAVAAWRTRHHPGDPVAFEASGYYMHHPCAPARMADELPDARLIVMLRDPVERAYSAYLHEKARGFETETFERALQLEEERLRGEAQRMLADPRYVSVAHRHHAYRGRGRYAEQLAVLRRMYDPEQILVLESERFFADPHTEYARVLAFLGLPPFSPARFDAWNARPHAPMPEHVRDELCAYFSPHDAALARMLGWAPAWCVRRSEPA